MKRRAHLAWLAGGLFVAALIPTGGAYGQCGEPAAAGDLRTAANGTWANIATWEEWNGAAWMPASVFPTSATAGSTTICAAHTVQVAKDSLGGIGTVEGVITGADSTALLVFTGSSFKNGGSLFLIRFEFKGGDASWSGTGDWMNHVVVVADSVTLTGDVTIKTDLTVAGAGHLALGAHTLDVDGTLSARNVIVGTGGSMTAGSGLVDLTQDISLKGAGSWNAPVRVFSGTTTVDSTMTLLQDLAVLPGAELHVGAFVDLVAQGNVTNNGTISGDISNLLIFEGDTFTHNGLFDINTDVSFNKSGTQTMTGTSVWDLSNLNINSNSTTRLGGDTTFETFPNIGGTLALQGHTLVLQGGFASGLGSVTGPGSVEIADNYQFTGVFWDAPITVLAGWNLHVAASVTLGDDVDVENGAGLQIGADATVTVEGDVTNNGRITGTNTNSTLDFEGGSFTHNDSLGTDLVVHFSKNGPQIITGSAVWRPAEVAIRDSSSTRLDVDLVFQTDLTVDTAAGLSLLGHTLELDGTASARNLEVVGSISGVAFLKLVGDVNLIGRGVWNAPMQVVSGQTVVTDSMIFSKDLQIDNGSTLKLDTLVLATVQGNLLNDGAIDQVSHVFNGFLGFEGDTLQHSGAAQIEVVRFDKSGIQYLIADTTWTFAQLRIQSGSTTILGSNLSLVSILLEVDGTLELGGDTLFLDGGTGVTNVLLTGQVSNTGQTVVDGVVVFNMSTGVWDAPLLVRTGGTVSMLTSLTFAKDVEVESGAEIEINSIDTMTVLGDMLIDGMISVPNGTGVFNFAGGTLRNNGSISGPGVARFSGPGAQILSGDNTGAIGRLEMATADTVEVKADQFVSAELLFSRGMLNLESANLNLGQTGMLVGEADTSRIIGVGGTASAIAFLINPVDADSGNLGLAFTSGASPGETIVSRGHMPQMGGGSADGIQRFFDVDVENQVNGTLAFSYFESELGGMPEAGLQAYESIDGGTTWIPRGGSPDTANNSIEVVGLIRDARWTLGGEAGFLPIHLVDAKVFLEGPYNGFTGTMDTTLLSTGAVPLSQPYDDAFYDGTTREYDAPASVSSLPPGTVDWVLLTLRNGVGSPTSVDTALAFVLSDGALVDTAGRDTVDFLDAPRDSLYLVVRHRNHMGVMSADRLDFAGSSATWDFTAEMARAYSGGSAPMADLGDGNFGMFGGDYSADGQATATDFNLWLVDTKAAAMGYEPADGGFDGQVTANDFNLWLVRTKSASTSQVP